MSDLRMPDLNTITIAGRLTREPELKYISSGTALCNLSIANTRYYKDKSGEKREDTTFVDVQVWGEYGENLATKIAKGDPVLIEGALKTDSWEEKQTGQKRSKAFIKADRVCPLTWGAKSEGEDKPQQQRASRPVVEEPPMDDDLPFD